MDAKPLADDAVRESRPVDHPRATDRDTSSSENYQADRVKTDDSPKPARRRRPRPRPV